MNAAAYRLARLAPDLDRAGFDSGSPPLDRYLREHVTQDVRRRIAACFVALADNDAIAGFYTLASASVLLADLPDETAKRLPRYPSVPAVRMGRLAVDVKFRGRGLGGALLADALARALDAEIAAWAMLVDAKDDTAVGFYRHHGFLALPESPRTLFLPLATARAVLQK